MNRRHTVLLLVAAVLTPGWARGIGARRQPAGELICAIQVAIPHAWFDPAGNGGLITPFDVIS